MTTTPALYRYLDTLPVNHWRESLRADIRRGLRVTPKRTAPTWLYDDRGSALYEEITHLPEYYPARTETGILAAHADAIASVAGPVRTMVELGSGSSRKARLLLDALPRLGHYVPVDVSAVALHEAAAGLARAYPTVAVHALRADFLSTVSLPPDPARSGPTLWVFLGGTYGNLRGAARLRFLRGLRAAMAPGDQLLLGVDLVKPVAELIAAYDDGAGVTARFNLNLLTVLNRELRADFHPEQFAHRAVWQAGEACVEMRLRSLTAQHVTLPGAGLEVRFDEGEEWITETCQKFTVPGITDELTAAGLRPQRTWTDPGRRFALTLSQRR